jgi:nucleoside-diphosphate-sugar epimerase
LVQLIQEISGKSFDVSIEQSNRNDSQKTVADNRYLQSLLGNRSFTPLEEGISNFYSWMKQPNIIQNTEKWIKSSI